jgi:hypothetical protein
MAQIILAEGPPPLTQDAADAALDAIDFIAAVVRGYDAIDVTDIVRPIWRQHLAYYYPHLPEPARLWYANAPNVLTALSTYWPLLTPAQRQPYLQQWAMELPYMLWMVDPVLAQAQAVEMQQAQQAQLGWMRQQAAQWEPQNDEDAQLQAIDAFARRSQMTASFQNYSTAMANSTIDLMRAFNRH